MHGFVHPGRMEGTKLIVDPFDIFVNGFRHEKNERRVFDWNKAARVLRDRDETTCKACIIEDYNETVGFILVDGRPAIDHPLPYLSSCWGTPCLVFENGDSMPCWIPQSESPDWTGYTYWPESARNILKGVISVEDYENS